MSRCFPYPPPGYVRNGARGGDSLIESIEREREKAKTKQRKEKKLEKTEKRKEKEKNRIHEINDEKVKQLSDEKSCQEEKRKDHDLIGGYLPKKREDETEHLEKSSLTEEHEQPICSQNLCYLSDGTQSSKKRKMLSSPSNGSQNHGNIIRIRLSLCKHKEPNSKEQLCSTSGREDPLVQQKDVHIPRQEQYSLTPEPNKEVYCSDSWNKEIFAQNVAEAAFGTSLYENKKKRAESQYKSLIEDWIPVPLLHPFGPNDYDDQEWLFGTKQQNHQQPHGCKRLKAGNDVSSRTNGTLWPCTQYLPEADIYAYPYTIPF